MIPNMLDFIILIFIITCYFLSSLRGGVKQIFSLIVLIVSIVVAGRFHHNVAAVFPEKVFPESFAGAAGFYVIFLLAFGVLSFGGRTLDDIFFKRVHFGGIDRGMSIILGVLKGFILGCLLMVVILVNYPADESSLVSESVGAPYIMPAARIIVKLLPGEEREEFTIKEKELKKIWKEPAEEE